MIGMLGIHQERHLVRPERAFDLQAIDDFRSCPALGDLRTIIGQRGRVVSLLFRALFWICRMSSMAFSKVVGHELMHLFRLIAFHKVRRPAAASEELLQFLMLDAGQDGRVADLVAIEMQDRQHGSIGNRIEKLVGLPCGRQGAGFRFTVADDAGDDQIGIVERGPEGMAERISQLAAFVNRPGVVGATWLEIPPGNENCVNSFFSPASSWLMSG